MVVAVIWLFATANIRWKTAGGVFNPVITAEQVVRQKMLRVPDGARRGEGLRRASVRDEGVDAPRRDDLRQAAARRDRPGSTIAQRAEFMHDRAGGAQNVGEPSGKADGELHFQAGEAALALGERSELRFHTTVQVAGGDVQQARGRAVRSDPLMAGSAPSPAVPPGRSSLDRRGLAGRCRGCVRP